MTNRGQFTRAEIDSQPEAWAAALDVLRAQRNDTQSVWPRGRYDHVRDVINSDAELIRDFGYYSFEGNNKWEFDLTHGFTADVGFGAAVFWVEGDEVTYWDGEESSSPLASFGFGLQFFGDLTWRVHRSLIGVDVKYQTAADWLYVDHSNVRFGAHLGVAF